MARKRPSNSESAKPVLTLRVSPTTMARLDVLADEASEETGETVSRAAVAEDLLTELLKDGGGDVESISARERAAHKAASVLRSRLMAAVRAEMDALEAESG